MKRNIPALVVNIICLLCLLGTTVYLIVEWGRIPEMVPSHYDASGNIDRMSDKSSILILPIMGFLLFLMISVIEHFPQIWNTGVKVTPQNSRRVYAITRSMLYTTKLIMVLDFTYMTICTSRSVNLSAWFLLIFLVTLIGTICVHLILLYRAGK